MEGHHRFTFFRTRLFRAAFLLICLTIAVGVIRSVVVVAQKRGIVQARRTVLVREQAKRADLEAQLREATSAAFIERSARDKLGLVKEGESVVILDKSQISNSNTQKIPQEIPSWKQWWRLFF